MLRVAEQHWIHTLWANATSDCTANENKDFIPTMDEVWEQMSAKLKKNPVFLGSLISKLPKQNYRGDPTPR